MYSYISIAVACVLFGFAGGWKTQAWRHDAADLARQQVEARDHVKRIERGDEAAVSHEAMKAKTEIVYVDRIKRVDRIVERPVYSAQCWDSDGVRELNDAIAGSGATGEPAPALSGPAKPAR